MLIAMEVPETLPQPQREAILNEWRSMGEREIKLGKRVQVTDRDTNPHL